MKTPEQVRLLIAELENDWRFIQQNAQKNAVMADRIRNHPEQDEFSYAALGYTLHNLYNAFDAYFIRIAKFFENALPSERWHRSLLERMSLDIEEVRPALIDAFLLQRMQVLLAFRHVFRNLYQAQLLPNKVLEAQAAADGITAVFATSHQRFAGFLRDWANRLTP